MKKILSLLVLPLFLFASMQKVSVQLEWKHQFEFAGFYAAIEKGYYKDINLEVELKELEIHTNTLDDVLNSKTTFGLSSSTLIIEKSKGIPVVLLASYFKQSPLSLVVSKDIKNINGLRGKKIMLLPKEVKETSIGAMFMENNLAPSDYTLVKHDFSVEKFINGEVDAMSVFITNQTYLLDKAGIKYNIIDPLDYGINFYDVELFASSTTAKSSPIMVQNFINATNKGWEYALKNQKEIVELIYTKYSQKKSKEALEYEAKKTKDLFKTKLYEIGSIVPESIALNAIIYKKMGLIANENDLKKTLKNYIYSEFNQMQNAKSTSNQIKLTKKEALFIKNHPLIKVGNDQFWPPFDFYEHKQAKGFNVDYLKEITKLSGLKFEFVQAKNWENLVHKLKTKEIDILTALESTPSRDKFALFSDDILVTFESIVTRKNYPDLDSHKDLYGKKVAVIKGYDFEEEIRNNHKEIEMILFDTPIEALQALNNSKVDVFLENVSVARYLIGKHFMTNLKVGTSPDFPNLEVGDRIKIASRKDYKELHSIIEKSIKLMPQKTIKELHYKWLSNIDNQKNKLKLTEDEINFINQNNVIKIANEMDWAPFDFNEFGKPTGLGIEYIQLLLNKVGLKYEFINGYTWTELLELYQNKKIDVMPAFYKSKQREKNTLFTTPYYQGKLCVVSLNTNSIKSMDELKNKKIGIEKSDASILIVENHFKDSHIIEYSTTAKLFKKLFTNEVDAIICNPLLFHHYKKDLKLSKVGLIEYIDMTEEEYKLTSLYVGVQKDSKMLYSILQKSINSLSNQEILNLKKRWIETKTINNKNILNTQEIDYIKAKDITMCIDPDWMPFEKLENNKHIGMTSDFFKIMQKNLNLDIKLIQTQNWAETLEYAKNRKCDILSLAMTTPQRLKYLNFTSPYLSIPLVLATNLDVGFVADIESLQGKKVGITNGYAFAEILRAKYPNLDIVDVENIHDGLDKVKNKELFGYIGTLASIGYNFQNNYTGELKIAGKFEDKWELGVAVRNDDPILFNIMQKAVASVKQTNKREILNKWVAINYEKGTDYQLIWQILIIASILLLGILYWARKLSLLNSELRLAKIKADEATREKANFLANMSHEIKTPMNSIVGMSYLLKETILSDIQSSYVKKIENSSTNLLTLINNLLDFSKIEAKKMQIKKVDFKLVELINNVENTMMMQIYEKGLKFESKYDKSLNLHLYGDSLRLSQILTNLLSNAVKFTHEGKIEIVVKKINEKIFRFEVIDTGIGLTSEQTKNIFSSFTQADSSITRKYGGTGLGLAIAKELVSLLNGKIWVESTLHKGSKFIFELELENSILKNTPQNTIEQAFEQIVEDIKIEVSQEKIDKLFEDLLKATTKRRPQLCRPILNEIKDYKLNKKDEKLFRDVSRLITKYKFDDAKMRLKPHIRETVKPIGSDALASPR